MRMRRGLADADEMPPADEPPANRARVLIGGLGYHWQRDASFGLVAAEALASRAWPRNVQVEDLGYGALFVAQDLLHASPPYDRLVLIAGVQRDREPGRVYRRRWDGRQVQDGELQERIREAGAGVVDLDHLLFIAQHFDALPPDVRIFEFEPVDTAGGTGLSTRAAEALSEVIDSVSEVALSPPHGCSGSPASG